MTQSGFDINNLFQEAQSRWLKPAEVLSILQNHDKYQLTLEPPHRPTSGSLFLFNRRVIRYFRKDGHNWRKKRDGRTVGEAHERLKVGNVDTLNCYYAHGEDNPNFQRRSFWMLDPEYEHIVLVHYREINEGKPSPATTVQSPGSSSVISATQNCFPSHDLAATDAYESSSSGSVEVSSGVVIDNRGLDTTGYYADSSGGAEVDEALRRLKQQLSLNDESLEEVGSFESQENYVNESGIYQCGTEISKQDPHPDTVHASDYNMQGQLLTGHADGKREQHLQPVGKIYVDESKEYWNYVLESCNSSSGIKCPGKPLSPSSRRRAEEQPQWLSFNGSSSETLETLETNSDYYAMLFNQGEIGPPLEEGPSLTVMQKQKFTIREISPEWGFSDEATKVIIVGSFLCNPSESTWACMFGEDEVPAQIIQEGVICCEAPPHLPGKVTLCITSGKSESCSEVRQFDYRAKDTGCHHCNFSPQESSKSTEALLLLVQFVRMLFSDKSLQKEDNIYSGIHSLNKLNDDFDSWSQVIEALLVGSGTSSGTVDWLLQELLKDQLQQWLSSKTRKTFSHSECALSKKDQGIIHMVAGLGFEWALNPIIGCGVGVNFRDINGWTALHWAARFGREKMVASLIASGASAGAVTDPSAQDPRGQTPASIAASYGHKGLAGYLSEVALTSHLSSLVLEESELSKSSAEVEAERNVSSFSQEPPSTSEDQLSLKETLAAVRNATQAAARIQNAFRAHSFRKRQQRESAAAGAYSISSDDFQGLSAISRLAFGNSHDHNLAALSIQKKYRGWKGRKDFLAFRQKVVKIQAHVRGYQVRKNYYRNICWAVGILDKVVLRWRRKGAGLRGFRHDTAPVDEDEDEDILKVFRRETVDASIDEAVSRVLSMVDSPEARNQYRRMLERYRQAEAELRSTSEASTLTFAGDISLMEDDVVYKLM